MSKLIFNLNNENVVTTVSDNSTLFNVLKTNCKINSIKSACNQGDCGLCTVLLDGIPTKSCIVLAMEVENKTITTIEGLKEDPIIIQLQKSFEKHGSFQCGYCTPAFLLASWYLLKTKQEPTRDDIIDAINGVLCRCTGYEQIIDAIDEASKNIKS